MQPSLSLNLNQDAAADDQCNIADELLGCDTFDFSCQSRLIEQRRYARSAPYDNKNLDSLPTILDLSPPSSTSSSGQFLSWQTPTFQILVFVASYFLFPLIVSTLDPLISSTPKDIRTIIDSYVPGVSILFGTYCSLTASILYNRQSNLQETVTQEAAVLASCCQDVLNLMCAAHPNEAILACGGIAQQIRTLVSSSRGAELMAIIYDDPYSKIVRALDAYEKSGGGGDSTKTRAATGQLREQITQLNVLRSRRLSEEALALNPTHFQILGFLGFVILAAFVLASLGALKHTGSGGVIVGSESSVLFASICSVYVLFYNFANDLNDPFSGVYQLRRSGVASHLLKTKLLIVNNKLTRKHVTFEEKKLKITNKKK
ncbi:hypothetical protein ScalyP_jg10763 [Parmales sp. scaly parma]|nr:hypothetical protein ScalyP_jg10763 [Parmales sp. scaly parma]